MPLDVLGRTRATLMHSSSGFSLAERPGQSLNVHRAGDRLLQLLVFNEEFLVNASHQLALITSLPFVHTARRYYRLNVLVRLLGCGRCREVVVRKKGVKLEHLEEVKVVTRFP